MRAKTLSAYKRHVKNLEDYYERREDREGYCWCGCGQQTNTPKETNAPRGVFAGVPNAFIKGHHVRKSGPDYLEEDRGALTPCWVWQGAATKQQRGWDYGYGQKYDPRTKTVRRAHAVYYERRHGPQPEGLQYFHLCGTPECVNPDHLTLLSRSEIMQRSANTKKSRFSAADILEIRRLGVETDLTEVEVAQMFGTVRSWIGCIWRNEVFADPDYVPPGRFVRRHRRGWLDPRGADETTNNS